MELPTAIQKVAKPRYPKYLLDPTLDKSSPAMMLEMIEVQGPDIIFYADGSNPGMLGDKPLRRGTSMHAMTGIWMNQVTGEGEPWDYSGHPQRSRDYGIATTGEGGLQEWVVLSNTPEVVNRFKETVLRHQKDLSHDDGEDSEGEDDPGPAPPTQREETSGEPTTATFKQVDRKMTKTEVNASYAADILERDTNLRRIKGWCEHMGRMDVTATIMQVTLRALIQYVESAQYMGSTDATVAQRVVIDPYSIVLNAYLTMVQVSGQSGWNRLNVGVELLQHACKTAIDQVHTLVSLSMDSAKQSVIYTRPLTILERINSPNSILVDIAEGPDDRLLHRQRDIYDLNGMHSQGLALTTLILRYSRLIAIPGASATSGARTHSMLHVEINLTLTGISNTGRHTFAFNMPSDYRVAGLYPIKECLLDAHQLTYRQFGIGEVPVELPFYFEKGMVDRDVWVLHTFLGTNPGNAVPTQLLQLSSGNHEADAVVCLNDIVSGVQGLLHSMISQKEYSANRRGRLVDVEVEKGLGSYFPKNIIALLNRLMTTHVMWNETRVMRAASSNSAMATFISLLTMERRGGNASTGPRNASLAYAIMELFEVCMMFEQLSYYIINNQGTNAKLLYDLIVEINPGADEFQQTRRMAIRAYTANRAEAKLAQGLAAVNSTEEIYSFCYNTLETITKAAGEQSPQLVAHYMPVATVMSMMTSAQPSSIEEQD